MNIKPKTLNICLVCGDKFQVYPYLIRKGFGKYCSMECSKKENTKGLIKKGQRLSPKTEFKKGNIPWNWKGDNVGYKCLHDWVKKRLGKPQCCDFCLTTIKRKYEWANKSGNYKRELSDWIRLCTPCHRKYDNKRRKNWLIDHTS